MMAPRDPDGRRGAKKVVDADDLFGIGPGTDILIVDDDVTNLVAYEAALSPLGRRLVPVRSGVSALGKLLDQDFALMLLDVSMPDMNGIETARRIRARPRNKSLPIIFITGASSSTEAILEAYDVGACDFVIKPILPEVLRAKVRVYLDLQDRTRETLRQAMQLREAQRRLDEADEMIREREAAAATAHKLEKLQEATASLSQAMTPAEVAAVTVRYGAEAVNAGSAVMWLLQPDGSLVVEGSHAVPEEYLAPWRVLQPGSPTPLWRVLQGRQLWVEDAGDYAREAPEAFERARAADRVWAFAALPLATAGRITGGVVFSYQGVHRYTDEEKRFLDALVRATEQALERARLYVAEAEARRVAELANQRKDEFLAMLSHELRNPLWTLLNGLRLLETRIPASREHVAVLDRQVDHLKHMIEDLLDVSRIKHGKIQLRREPIALGRVIESALDLARPLIERHGHHVHVDVADHFVIDADRNRARQVVENLITNAAKYTPPGGRIEVHAEDDGELVRLSVRDNGRGIAPELLATLFDMFVQGERTIARSEGGLGIGLTLVRSVVELHGGSVEAQSAGVGQGSTFVVRWPRGDRSKRRAASEPSVSRPAVDSVRVLVVDDNVESAEMLASLLQAFGHDVAVAHDGASAIDAAQSCPPDVALLDIGLPVMDGYEVAERLREIPTCANTVLIALTGYGQPDDVARAARAGFARHFVKPVEIAEITALLAKPATDSD